MNWKRIPESQGWIQRIGEWAVRQRTFMPRMIDLEVSRVCNLSCPACMRRADSSLAQQRSKTQFCNLHRFREIHKQIPTLGTLNFMGDGEPLTNPELGDIIHYAYTCGIQTVITTNATLVTPKTIQHWKNNGVYRVHASIDATSTKLYESMRVGAKWEVTLQNLVDLGKSGIPLVVNMVLTQANLEEMPSMVRLCKEVGAQEVTFLMPICAYGDDTTVRPRLDDNSRLVFHETAELCKALGVKWIFPLTLNPTWRRFSFPFIRPEISIEGDLWACCYSLGRGKTWVFGHPIDITPGTYNMGNMFEEGFREVWYGESYHKLREVYKRSELPKGTVISRKAFLAKVQEAENKQDKCRFDHCEICPARWGIACS